MPSPKFPNFILAGFCAICIPIVASAENTLIGRNVEFSIQTFDEASTPIFTSKLHNATINESVEFGLNRQGVQNEVDVVPVLVDIDASRVEIRYSPSGAGQLMKAKFNGYVLRLDLGCATMQSARVDGDFTNIPFDNKRVRIVQDTLLLNVSNLKVDTTSQLAVDLELAGCS